MKGQKIIVSAPQPNGRIEGVVVSGTPSPGTVMEIVPSTLPAVGNFSYRAATRADGAKGGCPVLLEDEQQGSTPTTAYISGRHGRIYWPLPGDELNMLLRAQSGTGTLGSENVGDLLEVDGASGMLQPVGTTGATGAHASAPFQLLEHLGVALSGNTLVHVKFLGNNA